MKKHNLKDFVAGILVTVMLLGGIAYAATLTQTIEVSYSDIKIYMDGEEVDARDANGKKVEPFIYNGTTYLPVRAVAQAIGKDVSWDGVNKVIYLGARPGDVANWLEVGPYEYTRGEEYRFADNQFFTMSGKKYTNGYVLDAWFKAEALYNLNGKYTSLSFTVGHVDGSDHANTILNVYLDGLIAYTTELKYDDVARKITIPLNGALQMKIEAGPSSGRPKWGFSEGEFK